MDNLDPVADNQDPAPEVEITPSADVTVTPSVEAPVTSAPAPTTFSWKGQVGSDLANSPAMKKFEDTPDGLKKVAESYNNLEKLLGHEKVPLPKGPDDAEGIARFNKALGVPETAEQYNLPDVTLPGEMSKLTFDKATFANVAKEMNLTPTQATGLWKKYTEMSGSVYQAHSQELQNKLNENINALRAEWGDAFAGNVELGEMVISKFADNQEMGDFLTATLSKDPAGMKFLAKIGQQFSENKVGDFQYKRFSMTPDEAAAEITKIKSDPNHPYSSEKASQADHDAAVDHVNRLISISLSKKG